MDFGDIRSNNSKAQMLNYSQWRSTREHRNRNETSAYPTNIKHQNKSENLYTAPYRRNQETYADVRYRQPADPARSYNSIRFAPVIDNPQDFRSFSNQGPRHQRNSAHVAWSKGVAHSKDAISNSCPGSFRKPTRPLLDMVSLDWLDKMPKSKDKYVVKSARQAIKEDFGIVHESVWKAFVDRDSYMDLAKKFNSSNIELLKDKQRHEKGLICPSDYDYQIRRCVANAGIVGGTVYSATWSLLKSLIGERDLEEYVKTCAYSERELKICKLDVDLFNRLNIGEAARKPENQQNVLELSHHHAVELAENGTGDHEITESISNGGSNESTL